MAAAEAAADAGLLTIGGRAEFAHPLVRLPPTARQQPTIATGCIVRSPMPPTPRPTRTDGHGTVPAPPRGPMRRSPSSSNARPAVPRHVAASPPRPHSCTEQPSCHGTRHGVRTGWSQRLRRAFRLARSTACSASWPRRNHTGLTGSSAPEPCSFAATWRGARLRRRRRATAPPGGEEARTIRHRARSRRLPDPYGSAMSAAHLGRRRLPRDLPSHRRPLRPMEPGQEPPAGRARADCTPTDTPLRHRSCSRQQARSHRCPRRRSSDGGGSRRWPVMRRGTRTARARYSSAKPTSFECRSTRGVPMYLSALALDRAWNGDLAGARLLIAESGTVATATGNQLPPSRRSGSSRWKARKPTPPR